MDFDRYGLLSGSYYGDASFLASLSIKDELPYSLNKLILDILDCSVPVCEASDIEEGPFLGSGATMSVFEAKWQGQSVAVKKFHLANPFDRHNDSEDTLEFARKLKAAALEVRVLSMKSLQTCENVVKLIGASWTPDLRNGRLNPLLIVELANYKHRTLEDALPLPAEDIGMKSNLIWGIVNGLRAIHYQGVIHGDLKPSNILLFQAQGSSYPVPKLSDFGFCQPEAESLYGLSGPQTREYLEKVDSAEGTEYWLAPECISEEWFGELMEPMFQRTNKKPDPEMVKLFLHEGKRSYQRDLYSFGLVAWTIIVGLNVLGRVPGTMQNSERKQMWFVKFSGDLQRAFRNVLNKIYRLVDQSDQVVIAELSSETASVSDEAMTGEEASSLRFTALQAYLSSRTNKESKSGFESVFGSRGGVIRRNDVLNDALQLGKMRWQCRGSISDAWSETTGLMPVEILLLHQALNLVPKERFQAADWTERLRPIQNSAAISRHHFNVSEAFQIVPTSTQSPRENLFGSRIGDYQDTIPQSMWRSAFDQIVSDAQRDGAEPNEFFFVADCYFGGNGVKKSAEEGLAWMLKCARSCKTDEDRQRGRFAFLMMANAHHPHPKPLAISDEELEDWTIEFLTWNGLPLNAPRSPLKGKWERFAAKVRYDSTKALCSADRRALIPALCRTVTLWLREPVIFDQAKPTGLKDLARRYLLGGDRYVSDFRGLLINRETLPDIITEIADECFYRKMAATSSSKAFRTLALLQMGGVVGAGNSLRPILGLFDDEQTITYECDVAGHETHVLPPVLFCAMDYENWSTFHYLMSTVGGERLVNSRWRGHSLLFHAVIIRNPFFLTALLEFGANPNEGIWKENGELGATPLQAACSGKLANGQCIFIEPLEQHNCLFDEESGTLPRLVQGQEYDNQLRMIWIVQALVSTPGIDIEARPIGTESALYYAVSFGNIDVTRILLEAGASQCAFDEHIMFTAIASSQETALSVGHQNSLGIVQLLLQHGANPNVKTQKKDPAGLTPLIMSIQIGNDAVARTLLEAGADPNAIEPDEEDSNGFTALFIAITKKNLPIVRALLEAGADPNLPNATGNMTALHLAAFVSDLEVAILLLEFNADVSAKALGSATPWDIYADRHLESPTTSATKKAVWRTLLRPDQRAASLVDPYAQEIQIWRELFGIEEENSELTTNTYLEALVRHMASMSFRHRLILNNSSNSEVEDKPSLMDKSSLMDKPSLMRKIGRQVQSIMKFKSSKQ